MTNVHPLPYDSRAPPAPGVPVSADWSVMTITSVGYGDVAASPFNVAEQVICTSMMLFGGMLWSQLIGTFCGVAASLSPGVLEFRDMLSHLNSFMASNDLPPEMRYKLRE
jgi:hypothetical protein